MAASVYHNECMNSTADFFTSLGTLRDLAREIVSPTRDRDSLNPEAVALSRLLEQLTGLTPETQPLLSADETSTGSGLAISPIKAALCAREPLRTVTFIRGLAAAIDQARVSHGTVRVLYAGCGPFATLALPLMTLLDARQVRFTLLDIHSASLDSARRLIDSLGLQALVADYVLADACTLQLDAAALPHVIVSETMNAALRSEPQVAIMRHLAMQAPQALLVPQSITVEACLLRPGKELPPPVEPGMPLLPVQRQRLPLGPVFRLDAAAIEAWRGLTGPLPAGTVQLPSPLPADMQARLLTRIVAFGPHWLDDYESSLNQPQHLPGRPALTGGEQLRFVYCGGAEPGLALL